MVQRYSARPSLPPLVQTDAATKIELVPEVDMIFPKIAALEGQINQVLLTLYGKQSPTKKDGATEVQITKTELDTLRHLQNELTDLLKAVITQEEKRIIHTILDNSEPDEIPAPGNSQEFQIDKKEIRLLCALLDKLQNPKVPRIKRKYNTQHKPQSTIEEVTAYSLHPEKKQKAEEERLPSSPDQTLRTLHDFSQSPNCEVAALPMLEPSFPSTEIANTCLTAPLEDSLAFPRDMRGAHHEELIESSKGLDRQLEALDEFIAKQGSAGKAKGLTQLFQQRDHLRERQDEIIGRLNNILTPKLSRPLLRIYIGKPQPRQHDLGQQLTGLHNTTKKLLDLLNPESSSLHIEGLQQVPHP